MALPPGLLLARAVETGLTPRPVLPSKQATAERLGRISGAVARRWPGEALCLQRSLVLLWLLRRRRIDAELRVGVRRTEGGLIAHAWVESDGKPLNDLPSFCAEFEVLESAASTVGALRRAELVQ